MKKKHLYRNALCKKGNFLDLNVILMQKLGLNEAILIPELVRLTRHFTNLRQLTDDGYYFATYEYFAEKTGLTYKQVIRAIKHLEVEGIVLSYKSIRTQWDNGEKKQLKTKYYKVNTTKIDEFLEAGDGSVAMNVLDPGDEDSDEDGSWLAYSKILAKKIGPEPTIVFSDMYNTFSNYEAENNLLDGEWFPNAHIKLAEKCHVTQKTICSSYIPRLKDVGLIDVKYIGFPRAAYAKINWDVFEELMGYTDMDHAESPEEKLTKQIIEKAEQLSGMRWVYNHHIVGHVENRLKEGITGEQILNMLEFMYNIYKDDPDIEKKFSFSYLCGSRCKDWIKKMDKASDKEEFDQVTELTTKHICDAIKDFSDDNYSWEVSDARMSMIKHQLECGVSEAELIELAERTYKDLKKKKCCSSKYFNWKALYGEYIDNYGKVHSCFNSIMKLRAIKNKEYMEQHPEAQKKATGKTNFKLNTGGSKDNAASKPLSQESINYQNKCRERGVIGEDVF